MNFDWKKAKEIFESMMATYDAEGEALEECFVPADVAFMREFFASFTPSEEQEKAIEAFEDIESESKSYLQQVYFSASNREEAFNNHDDKVSIVRAAILSSRADKTLERKKPTMERKQKWVDDADPNGFYWIRLYRCPSCNKVVIRDEHDGGMGLWDYQKEIKFCSHCGQALDIDDIIRESEGEK